MSIIKRGNTLYLRKRVPRRYMPVEPREFALISLHTDSMEVAKQKEARVWADLIEGWEARMAGDTEDAEARMAAAKEIAAKRGFAWMAPKDVAKLPVHEVLERVEAIGMGRNRRPKQADVDAYLGASAEAARLKASNALKDFWRITAADEVGKSKDQIRRSRAPKEKAFRNFTDVCGDLFLDEIERSDLTKFKNWWAAKIEREGLTRNSANKDLIHVTSVIRRLAIEHDFPVKFDTKKLTFSEAAEKKTRDPIPDEWIKDKILAPGALDGLNDQARGILLGLINTGLRPSECAMLTEKQIILDAPVPHLVIEGVGRKLKTAHAKRKIPLVGVSLAAFQAHPQGFPRYADNPTLSATVNKYLRENNLLPDGCTLYGLRHAFEDRMLAAGFDDRIRRDLLGHSLTRERYGAGAKLEQVRDMLQQIAI